MSKRSKSKKALIVLGLLGLIFVVIFGVWSNRPVSVKPPEKAVEGVNDTSTYKPLETAYFTSLVPTSMVVKSQNDQRHGNTLYQQFLTSSQSTPGRPVADQLAITVGVLPQDGLSGLSDVQFRLQHNDLYRLTENLSPPEQGKIFVKTDNGYELSSFWVHGNYYVAVVYSGTPDRRGYLDEYMAQILRSWQWL